MEIFLEKMARNRKKNVKRRNLWELPHFSFKRILIKSKDTIDSKIKFPNEITFLGKILR
ncbi:hypothetical protein LEP1GSC171_0402 [Leptospira santarosai str. HAI1380]|nr:hypothetical protein LEP1GSC171_0402 [Leptospira santarosai str. HAI1380]